MSSLCRQDRFDAAYRAHANSLYHYIYYKCGNLQMAEDIVQESFLRLWQNCEKVDEEKVKAYLFTIGRNLMLNQIEHKKVVLKFERRDHATAGISLINIYDQENQLGRSYLLREFIPSLNRHRIISLMNLGLRFTPDIVVRLEW